MIASTSSQAILDLRSLRFRLEIPHLALPTGISPAGLAFRYERISRHAEVTFGEQEK